MKKKIYIAGCGGMLGEAFYQQFKDDYIIKCTDKDVNADWLSFLDFRDYDAYRKDVEDFQPDYLFHLGAYTDLEWCEQNADEVYLTNTLCVENAVYIANSLDIPVLYISTAGIFDGKNSSMMIGIHLILWGFMPAQNIWVSALWWRMLVDTLYAVQVG